VFDLGAYQGLVALMLAGVVGPHGSVVAVEAEPRNAHLAERSRKLNGIQQQRIIHSAVAEQSGSLPRRKEFDRSETDRYMDWGHLGVPAVSLDDLTTRFGPPDVVFMDVDGFQCQALRGGRQTLARDCDWFVEVHVGKGLEKEGGRLQNSFLSSHPERFECWIASETRRQFMPFDTSFPLLKERFFMVAIKQNPKQ
jgi:methyltransferase, FkbM family